MTDSIEPIVDMSGLISPQISFDPTFAQNYGIYEAIVLQQLILLDFELKGIQTRKEAKCFIWTSNETLRDEYFPYFERDTLIETVEHLEYLNYIVKTIVNVGIVPVTHYRLNSKIYPS